MKTIIGALSFIVSGVTCSFTWETYSPYNHFTKRMAPGIFSGGWLTERQLAYLADGGFKSVLSIADLQTTEVYNGVEGPFPSSADEIAYVTSLGLKADMIPATMTAESVEEVSARIHALPKPIFVHCHTGYEVTLFAELHLYLSGVVDSGDFYTNTLTLGYDYQADESAVALINEVTGLTSEVVGETIEQPLANGESSYRYYFWSHRIGNDYWYNLGQPLSTQVNSIAAAGYKSVISFRNNGEATTRLSTEPTTGPVDNDEFSDANGMYNVTAEQDAFESAGLQFYNLPVTGSDAWTAAQLEEYSPSIAEALTYGPVLVHCRSGYRSGGYMTAYLAQQGGYCASWAIQQARRIGLSFDILSSDAAVIDFYEEVLGC